MSDYSHIYQLLLLEMAFCWPHIGNYRKQMQLKIQLKVQNVHPHPPIRGHRGRRLHLDAVLMYALGSLNMLLKSLCYEFWDVLNALCENRMKGQHVSVLLWYCIITWITLYCTLSDQPVISCQPRTWVHIHTWLQFYFKFCCFCI